MGSDLHLADVDLPVSNVRLLDDQFREGDVVIHSDLNLGSFFKICWRLVSRFQGLHKTYR